MTALLMIARCLLRESLVGPSFLREQHPGGLPERGGNLSTRTRRDNDVVLSVPGQGGKKLFRRTRRGEGEIFQEGIHVGVRRKLGSGKAELGIGLKKMPGDGSRQVDGALV